MTRALLLALWFGILAPGFAHAAGPVLYVWTSEKCGPCRLFWQHYNGGDREFRQALDAAFSDVQPVVWEKQQPSRTMAYIDKNGSLPAFSAGDGWVFGYTGPDDLLARLGLRRLQAPAAAQQPARPSAVESGLSGRVEALAADVDRLGQQVDAMASWITQADAWVKNVDQRHEAAVAEDKSLGERIEGAVKTATQAVATVRAVRGTLDELRGRIAGDGHDHDDGQVVEAKPTKPPEERDAVGTVLEIGKIPASMIFGPLGGFAVGALGWAWERRRRRSRETPAAGESGGSRPPQDLPPHLPYTPPPPPPATQPKPEVVEVESARCKECLHAAASLQAELGQTRRELQESRRLAEDRRGEIARLTEELSRASQLGGTETRYVHVPAVDRAGEAYKEAIRRVAELRRNESAAVSLCRQIDAAAKQILDGQKVEQRKQTPPEARPGLWRDNERTE